MSRVPSPDSHNSLSEIPGTLHNPGTLQWNGQAILRMPSSADCRPSREALARRWKQFVDAHGSPDRWKPGARSDTRRKGPE
jgi:hypothetical protein